MDTISQPASVSLVLMAPMMVSLTTSGQVPAVPPSFTMSWFTNFFSLSLTSNISDHQGPSRSPLRLSGTSLPSPMQRVGSFLEPSGQFFSA